MSSATSSVTPSGRRSWQGSSPLPEAGALSTIRFFPFIISPPRTAPVIRTFSGAEMSFCPSPFLFLCFSVAKSSSKSSLENLLRFSVFLRKTFSFFSAFRWRKAAKATRPIPMSASGRLKAASGDYSRVCKQTVPAAVAFSPPSALSPSEPSRESPCGKRKNGVARVVGFAKQK